VVGRPPRRQLVGPTSRASQTAAWLGGEIDEALADIGVPAFILDRTGVVQWQNARAYDVVGDARGRHFSSVVSPESVNQPRVEFTKQMLGSARTSDRDLVLRGRHGTRVPVAVHAVTLAAGRRVVGIFGILDVAAESATPPLPLSQPLTPRQHEVLVQLARGASTDQIAASLGLARETVRNHVRGLLRALRVHSRLEAVAEARRRGLLAPPL
jgi:DNA-binding CsgD family transcriptional regulator